MLVAGVATQAFGFGTFGFSVGRRLRQSAEMKSREIQILNPEP